MIGDAVQTLNAVRHPKNLRRAFRYALWDRPRDYFYDPFELEHAAANETRILREIAQELRQPEAFKTKPAYAFFPPKTPLCYRRMVYVPFKDLVVRYAILIVVAGLLDRDLSPRCFANRRARGEASRQWFLKDFAAVSWPSFCNWQRECAENPKYGTLLRTDISAFYDSISHEYLIETLAQQLAIESQTEILNLFKKILQVPVLSYCHLRKQVVRPEVIQQGLPIGNNTEGFLANLYLKSVDDDMDKVRGVAFGRYNDDMRIFAPDRVAAKLAILILQEKLLTKGLNLNAAKTEIAEKPDDVENLRSKAYELYDYLDGEDDEAHPTTLPVKDLPFDEFSRTFSEHKELEEKDAKDFCHFVNKLVPLTERRPWHVDRLREVLTRYQGASKYASWLLVQTTANPACPRETGRYATSVFLDLLPDKNVSSYGKYRLLHHLSRERRNSQDAETYCYFDRLGSLDRQRAEALLPDLVGEQAFELNIIALYALRILGASHKQLDAVVREHAKRSISVPIKNVLTMMAESPAPVEATALADVPESEGQEYY